MAIGKSEVKELRWLLEKARLEAAKENLDKIQKKKEETRRMMKRAEKKRSEAEAALEKATSQVDQLSERFKKLQEENSFYMNKVYY